ncbi:hypothetical protein L6452_23480 [Arctium lappa]|uniref:Uncharacterized protein n=1 Tax=Arctium lappa TaxID=4217 RepID=A0ACB9B2E8_ARCLA|nr:hypothetical protein L6452_23480 [Arctium lappa]
MDQLKQIHLQTIVRGVSLDPLVSSKIIAFCCRGDQGGVDYARQVFDGIPEPKVFLWNMMIKGYSCTSSTGYAVAMYVEMLRRNVKPDNYTFPFLLKGFTRSVGLGIGKGIHCHVCKFGFGFGSNAAVDTSLIRMYSLRGNVDDARRVFDASSKSDAIAWNIMIAGYNRSKLFDESRKLFQEMEKRRVVPTSVTLVSMLSACSKLKDGDGCKRVHGYVKDGRVASNLVLHNALIDAYAACGEMNAALAVFEKMKTRDVISWTAVLSGFLNAGKLDIAREFFNQMPDRDLVSWTAMIDGYDRSHLLWKEIYSTLEMLTEVLRVSGYTPQTNETFLDIVE